MSLMVDPVRVWDRVALVYESPRWGGGTPGSFAEVQELASSWRSNRLGPRKSPTTANDSEVLPWRRAVQQRDSLRYTNGAAENDIGKRTEIEMAEIMRRLGVGL